MNAKIDREAVAFALARLASAGNEAPNVYEVADECVGGAANIVGIDKVLPILERQSSKYVWRAVTAAGVIYRIRRSADFRRAMNGR